VFASPSFGWDNPFNTHFFTTYGEPTEPQYNITLKARFGIAVEPSDPIPSFERKPLIYITYKTDKRGASIEKKIPIRILNKDTHYPKGKLTFPTALIVCEWKRKLPPGNYELWVQPRNNGDHYEPSRVTGSFTLHRPVVTSISEIEGSTRRRYLKVTGRYFSLTPKIFVKYAVVRGKKIRTHRRRCRIESHEVNRITGDSDAIYSFLPPENKKYKLVTENKQPLIMVHSKLGMCTSSLHNTTFSSIDVGAASNPTFGDIDGDGDMDMVVGDEYKSSFSYFENTGSATEPVYTERKDSDNPFNGFTSGSYLRTPFLADIDADGDLNLIAGALRMPSSGISYWENTGSITAPKYEQRKGAENPFNGIGYQNANSYARPILADIDNDGDLDLIYSDAKHNKVFFYQNTGTPSTPLFQNVTGTDADPFRDVNFYISDILQPYLSIAFIDVNSDGDLDIVSSDYSGHFYYYRNSGTPEVPKFENASKDLVNYMDVKSYGTPAITDINGDGKEDIVSGANNGKIYAFPHGNFFFMK